MSCMTCIPGRCEGHPHDPVEFELVFEATVTRKIGKLNVVRVNTTLRRQREME